MTVIAWDGTILAADRQVESNGLIASATKIVSIPYQGSYALFGAAGYNYAAQEMKYWLSTGGDPAKFPKCQSTTEYAICMVIQADRKLKLYTSGPYPFAIEDKFYAIGCGAPYAVAAMHLGASAKEAVEIANIYDAYCGGGVDTLDLACIIGLSGD